MVQFSKHLPDSAMYGSPLARELRSEAHCAEYHSAAVRPRGGYGVAPLRSRLPQCTPRRYFRSLLFFSFTCNPLESSVREEKPLLLSRVANRCQAHHFTPCCRGNLSAAMAGGRDYGFDFMKSSHHEKRLPGGKWNCPWRSF